MTNSDKSGGKTVAAEESARLRGIWDSNEVGRLPQGEFGETYGIGGQSAVANFLHGRSILSMKAGLGFARGLGVSLDDFSPRLAAEAREISETLLDLEARGKTEKAIDRRPPRALAPPLLGELRAAADGGLEQVLYNEPLHMASVELLSRDEGASALRIRGDVFFPRYRAGEFLIVSNSAERIQGADVLVKVSLGPLLLMQWNWCRDGEVQLLPLNGVGSPMTIAEEDIAWSERVLGVAGPDSLRRPT